MYCNEAHQLYDSLLHRFILFLPTETSILLCTAAFSTFRETLTASFLWTQAAETIDTYMNQLQTGIQSAGSERKDEHDVQETDITEGDDGLGYTFVVDRKNPTAESLHDDLLPLVRVVVDAKQVSSQAEALTAVFRFLRNACATSRNNQDACLNAGLIKRVRLAFC